MTQWLHILGVIAIVIYSIFQFIKEKRAFHIIIIVWASSTVLTYVIESRPLLWALGIAQLIMFFIVVFLMFKRRGERRMNTLELLSRMAADSLPSQADEIIVEAKELEEKSES